MNGRFVLHRHDTEVPHLDLGLEVGDEVACWRLADLPSFDPADPVEVARLADRPLAHLRFSGIALGLDCGDGALDVVDQGLVHSLRRGRDGRPLTVAAALAGGEARVWLEGSILQGGWDLVPAGERWELRKVADLVARGARALGIRRSAIRRDMADGVVAPTSG